MDLANFIEHFHFISHGFAGQSLPGVFRDFPVQLGIWQIIRIMVVKFSMCIAQYRFHRRADISENTINIMWIQHIFIFDIFNQAPVFFFAFAQQMYMLFQCLGFIGHRLTDLRYPATLWHQPGTYQAEQHQRADDNAKNRPAGIAFQIFGWRLILKMPAKVFIKLFR